MKLLMQKVKRASVNVDDQVVGRIGPGLLVFVGMAKDDDEMQFVKAIDKILNARIWAKADKGFDQNVIDIEGEVLLVSQFTLLADMKKGNRPDFSQAMPVNRAKIMYNRFYNQLKERYSKIEQGVFQAKMEVELVNDGPVTIILDV